MSLRKIAARLDSFLEARILIKHYTGLNDADLIVNDSPPLTLEQELLIERAIEQRLTGRPLSKIIGYKEFYGRKFIVTDDVLDPRPETELIVDLVKQYAKTRSGQSLKILDLGTGSGCLILTLLAELPTAIGTAADISPQALKVAKENAHSLNLPDRIEFIQSDWLDHITDQYDVIVSNPPYIKTRTLDDLDITVRLFDPTIALDGGEDGLNPYKILFPQIRHNLKSGGLMAFEHGKGQSEDIIKLLNPLIFKDILRHFDYAGHDRIVTAIVL